MSSHRSGRVTTVLQRQLPHAHQDADAIRREAARRIDQLPELQNAVLDDFQQGRIAPDAFQARLAELEGKLHADRQLVDRLDTWTWLTRIFGRNSDGEWTAEAAEDGNLWLFLPFQSLLSILDLQTARAVLRKLTEDIRLTADQYPEIRLAHDETAIAELARHQGKAFAAGVLLDQRASLRSQGWQRRERYQEYELWVHPDAPNEICLRRPQLRVKRSVQSPSGSSPQLR